MKRFTNLLILTGCLVLLEAEEETVTLHELLDQGAEMLEDHLDPEVLKRLPELEESETGRWLRDLQAALAGDYLFDLARFREESDTALKWLQAVPELRPYAAWLRTRLDYFDVVDRLRLIVPEPEPRPGALTVRRRSPTAVEHRRVWRRVVLESRQDPAPTDRVTHLRGIFDAAGVPSELVWLAEVESSFESTARSPAGAVGLFQLMPDTARALGLSLDPVDERLQPERNAEAAARHLRYLYHCFKDWPLAVAAYNAGEGRIRRALRADKARRFEEIAPRLPTETQLYVPKVEAILHRREGRGLARLPAPSG